jgi:hypothetical protein
MPLRLVLCGCFRYSRALLSQVQQIEASYAWFPDSQFSCLPIDDRDTSYHALSNLASRTRTADDQSLYRGPL